MNENFDHLQMMAMLKTMMETEGIQFPAIITEAVVCAEIESILVINESQQDKHDYTHFMVILVPPNQVAQLSQAFDEAREFMANDPWERGLTDRGRRLICAKLQTLLEKYAPQPDDEQQSVRDLLNGENCDDCKGDITDD